MGSAGGTRLSISVDALRLEELHTAAGKVADRALDEGRRLLLRAGERPLRRLEVLGVESRRAGAELVALELHQLRGVLCEL